MATRLDFDSVYQKIDQALAHMQSFNDLCRDTLKTTIKVSTVTQADGSPGIRVDYIPDLPPAASAFAGDAVHNLRSALDHFAWIATLGASDKTAFPIWRKPQIPSSDDVNGLVRNKLKGARTTLIDKVKTLRLHGGGQGGEDWLWTLDHLDIVDKHRLVPVTVPKHHAHIRTKDGWTTVLIGQEPIRQGEILHTPAPAVIAGEATLEFAFFVAFDESEIDPNLRNSPAIDALASWKVGIEGLMDQLIPLA